MHLHRYSCKLSIKVFGSYWTSLSGPDITKFQRFMRSDEREDLLDLELKMQKTTPLNGESSNQVLDQRSKIGRRGKQRLPATGCDGNSLERKLTGEFLVLSSDQRVVDWTLVTTSTDEKIDGLVQNQPLQPDWVTIRPDYKICIFGAQLRVDLFQV